MSRMIKVVLVLMSVIIFVSGCSSDEELKEGIDLYKESTFDSMLDAREFFKDYRDNNLKGKKANKWIKKIDKKIGAVAKDRIGVLYEDFRYEEALELTAVLKDITPDDPSVDEARAMIVKDFQKQKDFESFSEFLVKKYDELYYLFELWNTEIEAGVLNDGNTDRLKNATKQMLPLVSKMRIEVQEMNLTINNDVYSDHQDDLFEYVNKIERDLTRLVVNEVKGVMDYKGGFNSFDPETFNKKFLGIQSGVNNFIDEIDDEGNRVNKIDGRIEFKKLDEIDVGGSAEADTEEEDETENEE